MRTRPFGEIHEGLVVEGRPVTAGVFDERQVRAAAGITLMLGSAALALAFLSKEYRPIETATAFFFVDFALRVGIGLGYSPVGRLARWLVPRGAPQWVSARPKRFAWSLGLVMSLAMTVITNSHVRGALPLSICLVCLALMWMEAVLGICLGCEIHSWMVRRGWAEHDAAFEICSGDVCAPRGKH